MIVEYMKTILDGNEGPKDWQNLFAVSSGWSRGGARGTRPPAPHSFIVVVGQFMPSYMKKIMLETGLNRSGE